MTELPDFEMKKKLSVHSAAQNVIARETSCAARLDLSLCKLHNTILKTMSNARTLRITVLLWKECYIQTSASGVHVFIYLLLFFPPALMNHTCEL